MNNRKNHSVKKQRLTNLVISVAGAALILTAYLISQIVTVKPEIIASASDVILLSDNWYINNNDKKEDFTAFGKEIGNRKITICHNLDFYNKEYSSIGLYNHYSAITVALDNRVIYTYGSEQDLDNGVFLGNYYAIIELPDNTSDYSSLRITYYNDENQTIYAVENGNATALARRQISNALTTVVLIILSIASIVLLAFLGINRRTRNRITPQYNWLAIFTVVATLWALTHSQLLQSLGFSAGTINLLNFEIYMLLPYPILFYMYYACDCYKRGTILMLILVSAVFVILNFLNFTHIASFLQSVLCMHAVICLTIAFSVLKIFTEFFINNSVSNRFNMFSILFFSATGIAQYMEFYSEIRMTNFTLINIGFIAFIIMQVLSLLEQINIQLREDDVAVQKQIEAMNVKLRQRNELLYKSFGQFLPDTKINEMIQTNEQAKQGGTKEVITVMITDLRGFSQIVENSEANRLIEMLNYYLEEMVRIIQKWGGTVIEYMGDGILAVFGAPVLLEDHADNAVCAAVEMQNYMRYINAWNKQHDFQKVEMGIGINSGETFVGYIGSQNRLEFDVIGATVNLASRIETYSTGGQVLISENTRKLLTTKLEIKDEQSVLPKGSRDPVKLYCVGDIGEPYNIKMFNRDKKPQPLAKPIPILFRIVEGKHVSMMALNGEVIAASDTNIQMRTNADVNRFDNIDIDYNGVLLGKIVGVEDDVVNIRFTSTPRNFKGFGN